ncbi:MAG: hypothetical protein SVM80_08680 [Halobacteriota archaeon]|nr:hypothetical protein [Halobacteriota archaeon]
MNNPAILSAIIAALVSLSVAIISYFANRRKLRSDREALEIQLKRNFTEKLYDKRLEIYPLAFEITDSLRGEHLFGGKFQCSDIEIIKKTTGGLA